MFTFLSCQCNTKISWKIYSKFFWLNSGNVFIIRIFLSSNSRESHDSTQVRSSIWWHISQSTHMWWPLIEWNNALLVRNTQLWSGKKSERKKELFFDYFQFPTKSKNSQTHSHRIKLISYVRCGWSEVGGK